ncbi:CRISPR-associated endoribonuclease Cas6 [[Clostridium] dakarense]|uniref:CRISPR-associated endoribonuclease Cas6 n=1 Tax=Faecalimicrobium dakarense TaxID=1301100 RepID=UPI0004B466E8|nr:CRISPR-associated endoribonuclease Cas6 [[Clostridium] dakarense]
MKNIIELQVKVFLLKDINLENTSQEICKIIDNALTKSEIYTKFHNENKFKNYSFNMLYPLEKDKVYKKENIYTFIIRTVDNNLSEYFMKELKNQYTDEIKVLTVSKKIIPIKHIESIHTITPIVSKFDKGYWKQHSTIDVLEKRITENLIKKYNNFYDEKIDEDFELFTAMSIVNKKPISTKYKDISLLGDKINFRVADNEKAQEIINFALGVGVGEMNSRGLGFINYRWL